MCVASHNSCLQFYVSYAPFNYISHANNSRFSRRFSNDAEFVSFHCQVSGFKLKLNGQRLYLSLRQILIHKITFIIYPFNITLSKYFYILYVKSLSAVVSQITCQASWRAEERELTEEKEEEPNDERKKRRRGKRKTFNKCSE